VTSRLKVLQVVDNLGMGGAEVWLVALLKYWKQRPDGPEIHFLSTGAATGVFDDEVRSLGATLHRIRYSQLRIPAFAIAFRSLLKRERYDAVHDHQDFAAGWHLALAGSAAPPVRIVHVHNPAYQVAENYGGGLRKRMTGELGRSMIARHATGIAGTSKEAIRDHGLDGPAFTAIPKAAVHCGFDPAPFAAPKPTARKAVRAEFGWPDSVRLALFVGRMDISPDLGHPRNHKNSGFGVTVAIEACRSDPDLRFLFAGPPSPATLILQERIDAAGFHDRIRLCGIRNDIAKLMCAGDVLLFPSRSEGLGMVAVEAQSAGLPVLASTGVPRECVVVSDLVTFKDVEEGAAAWAAALVDLARRPTSWINCNRLVAASPFSIAKSAAALEALYRGEMAR